MVEHAYCRPPSEAPTASPKKEKKRGRPTKNNKELQDVTNVTAPAKKGKCNVSTSLCVFPITHGCHKLRPTFRDFSCPMYACILPHDIR